MEATAFKIEIDGKACKAKQGETVLAVAQRNGMFIPALCAHPLLQPYGACRLCLVEVEQGKRKRIVASCAYSAQAGLRVWTVTEDIRKLQQGTMELLLARCPNSTVLWNLAGRIGVTMSRFDESEETDELCMLCGLCVRLCHEVIGASAISFARRGKERRVDSPFSLSAEECLGCGACAAICPTGAIKLEREGEMLRLKPFNTSVAVGRCISCRKQIAAVPLMDLVRERALLPLIAANLCPDCRASRRAEVMAAAV